MRQRLLPPVRWKPMDVIDRLHAAVNASPLSKKQIAHLAGMTPWELSRLLHHKLESPSIHDIEAVASAIGISMASLYVEEAELAAETAQARDALQVLSRYLDQRDASPARVTSRPKRKSSRTARPFPVAATPNVEMFAGEESRRREIPPELWSRGARFVARAIGDSMTGAGIESGDLVFFRPPVSINAARGKIVVCRLGGGVYLKRLQRTGDRVRLVSDNERYGPIVVGPEDDFELYGIVVLQ
jgi:SOS-response transcriptional repressor LexA